MITFHRCIICLVSSFLVMTVKPAFAQLPDVVYGGEIRLQSNSCFYLIAPAVQNNLQALYRAFNNPYTARLSSGADEENFSYVINWQRSGGSTKRLNGSVSWKKKNPSEISWRMRHDNLEVFGVPFAATVELEAQFRKHFSLLSSDVKSGLFDCAKAPSSSPKKSVGSDRSAGPSLVLPAELDIDWKDVDKCRIRGAFLTGKFAEMMSRIEHNFKGRIINGSFTVDRYVPPRNTDTRYSTMMRINAAEGSRSLGYIDSFIDIEPTTINVRFGGATFIEEERKMMESLSGWFSHAYYEEIKWALDSQPNCKDTKLPFEPLNMALTAVLEIGSEKADENTEIRALRFTRDSNKLLMLRQPRGGSSRIDILDLTRRQVNENIAAKIVSVLSADISPDGKLVAIATGGESIIWDIAANKALHTFNRACQEVKFSTDGKLVVSASQQGSGAGSCADITLHDVASGKLVKLLSSKDGKAFVGKVAFDQSSALLAAVGGMRQLSIWDVVTGSTKTTINVTGNTMALAPDGMAVFVVTPTASPTIWSAATGANIGQLSQNAGVVSASFSPDGKLVVTGNTDAQVILWDHKTLRALAGWSVSKEVTVAGAVAISPDGKVLATGDRRGTIQLWDLPAMLEPNFVEKQREIHESGQRLKGVSKFVTNAVREAQKQNNRKPVSVHLEILPSKLEAKEGKPTRNVALHFDSGEKDLKVAAPDAQIIKYKIDADGTIRRLGD